MSELEEISFRNRVLFFENELLNLQRTGKSFVTKSRQNKANWAEVIRVQSGNTNNQGKYMYLTPRAIAVLTGIDGLDNIDDVIVTVSRLDVLSLLDRVGYPNPML